MPQFEASLTDDSRIFIYDCNKFIVQATEVWWSSVFDFQQDFMASMDIDFFKGQMDSAQTYCPNFFLMKISGLYFKNILMIVSDDRKLSLYYKCFIRPSLSLS